MKRLSIMGALTAIVVGCLSLLTPQTASAAVTCVSYHSLYPTEASAYPNDWSVATPDGHFQVCQTFTHAASNSIRAAVANLSTAQKTKLALNGVTFFYFADRGDAVSYMQATLPYSLSSSFAATTSRCGNTGYYWVKTPKTTVIASEIYDTCQLTGSAPSNPNLAATALHEAGHAYDFSLAAGSANIAISPSESKAYRLLMNASTNTQTAASDLYFLDSGDVQQPHPTTCAVFGSTAETAVEVDLGKPTAVTTPVCTNGVVNTPFTGKTNKQITQSQDPYFSNPPAADQYKDIFAEGFALHSGSQGSPTLLPVIDHTLPFLRCTYLAMELYADTGNPPSSTTLQGSDCPVPAAGDWNAQ